MNTKHTAGKWVIVQHSQFCNGTEIVCNGKVITTILNQRATDIEGKANAKLMAAAPELLQMVYDLKKCIERLTSDEALTQYDKDKEAQWIGEAHELLHTVNPDYYINSNAYINNLPDFPELEKLFKDNGYILDIDLSNTIIIDPINNPGVWVEYDQLPEHLKTALDLFAERHELN